MLIACEWNHREKRTNPTTPAPSKISLDDTSVPRMFISLMELDEVISFFEKHEQGELCL